MRGRGANGKADVEGEAVGMNFRLMRFVDRQDTKRTVFIVEGFGAMVGANSDWPPTAAPEDDDRGYSRQ